MQPYAQRHIPKNLILFIIFGWIHLPIAFGSNWYGGIPQCAGGGVVNGSPTPLWQKNGGSPILFAYYFGRKEEMKRNYYYF